MFSKRSTLIGLAIVIAVLPFIGIPFAWKSALLSLSGVGVGLVAYFLRPPEQKVHRENIEPEDEIEEGHDEQY